MKIIEHGTEMNIFTSIYDFKEVNEHEQKNCYTYNKPI